MHDCCALALRSTEKIDEPPRQDGHGRAFPSKQARVEVAYRVSLVAGALKVDHAVQAGVRCAIALVAMAVKLLLGKDIPTVLFAAVRSQRPSDDSSAAHLQGRVVQSGGWSAARRGG